MSYKSLLDQLYHRNLQQGVKLGLENPKNLDNMMENPSSKFESVHIAGSNGKGSVALKIANGCRASGLRVGLFTSPHISCFRERIRVNGEMIPEKAVSDILGKLMTLDIPATFFELTTALAFQYFAECEVDIAIIETGLGGRFDATNIIIPRLSVITSISLEHTEMLGNTLEAIAIEKAGIIKPGVPVLLGPNARIVEEVMNTPVTIIEGEFSNYEEENTTIAERAMQMLGLPVEAIASGLKAKQPCRMEEIQPGVILDVAHNPDALQKLFQAIEERPIRVLCGFSKNKELTECLSIIAKQACEIHLIQGQNPRCAPVKELRQILLQLNFPPSHVFTDDHISLFKSKKTPIIVCGSFYIMNVIRSFLGVNEESDPIELNENWGKSHNLVKSD